MELHISAGSGCQQGSVFNLSLFKVSVLDKRLYIQRQSCTRDRFPFPFVPRISDMKLQSYPRPVLFRLHLFL